MTVDKLFLITVLPLLVACGSQGGPLGTRQSGEEVDSCRPQEALCDGADIVRCDDDGLGTATMQSCDEGSVCSWCGLLPGCTPPPTCTGHTEGLPHDVTFSDACNPGFAVCSATTDATKTTFVIDVSAQGRWTFEVPTQELMATDTWPANSTSGAVTVQVHLNDVQGHRWSNWAGFPPPGGPIQPGTVRISHTLTTVHIEYDATLFDLSTWTATGMPTRAPLLARFDLR